MNRKKLLKATQTEVDTGYLYKIISTLEKDSEISSFYAEMAKIENMHAGKMIERAKEAGYIIEPPGPSARARILARIARVFGYNLILGVLVDTEKSLSNAAIKRKSDQGESVLGNEDRHVNILKSISQLSGEKLGKVEGRHRNVGGNALRAAVLGANDGLVSNLSLVMGVAGATAGGSGVLIAGLAGLLAGAISMALGEWISVKSSQELYERQIELETEEIENNPDEEKQELILLYKAKGLSEEQAIDVAEKHFAVTDEAVSILVKEELGINPEELKGSAWEAAIASFALFVSGAIIPVFPFFFTEGQPAILWSLGLSTVGLVIIGGSITLFTGKSFLRSGLRQVLFGLAAAGVTFIIGKLIGGNISG